MSISTDCLTCCRLCLEERSDASINCLSDELDKVIQNVLGFEILSTDECSTNICLSCFQKVSVFHLFKVKAVNNQQIIHQMKALQAKLACNNKVVVKKEVDESDDIIFVSEGKANQPSVSIPLNDDSMKRKPTARKSTTQIPPASLDGRVSLPKDKVVVQEISDNESIEEGTANKIVKRLKVVCDPITEKDLKGFKLSARDRKLLRLKPIESKIAKVVNSPRKKIEKPKEMKEMNSNTPTEKKPMMVILKGSSGGLYIKSALGNKQNCEDAAALFNLPQANTVDKESIEKLILRLKEKHNVQTSPVVPTNTTPKLDYKQNSNSITSFVNGAAYTMKFSRATETLTSNGTYKPATKTNTPVQIGNRQSFLPFTPKTGCSNSIGKPLIYIPVNKDLIANAMNSSPKANKPDSSTPNAKNDLHSINDSKVKILSVNEINKRSFDQSATETTSDKQPIRISILKGGTVLQIRLADTKNNEINFNALKPAEKQAVRSTILNESHRQRIFAQIENNKLDHYSKELLQFLNIPYKQPTST